MAQEALLAMLHVEVYFAGHTTMQLIFFSEAHSIVSPVQQPAKLQGAGGNYSVTILKTVLKPAVVTCVSRFSTTHVFGTFAHT